MLAMWRSTVRTLRTSSVAISWLERPRATRRRTSTSRAVRPAGAFVASVGAALAPSVRRASSAARASRSAALSWPMARLVRAGAGVEVDRVLEGAPSLLPGPDRRGQHALGERRRARAGRGARARGDGTQLRGGLARRIGLAGGQPRAHERLQRGRALGDAALG